MTAYDTSYVDVNGITTHYLEAGREHDETVLLLHSGEFGATAAFSWKDAIGGLADHYHVIAPDMIGYGHTEKLFSFDDQFDLRVTHIGEFLETLCIDRAHVIGNSLGGGDVLSVASEQSPLEWPIEKAVSISGGGGPPEQFQNILTEFDGSRAAMVDILDVLFAEQWWDESYLETRIESSHIPGQWQNTAAIRFDPPFEQNRTFRRSNQYERIEVPTLVMAGADDVLKSVEKMRSVYDEVATNNPDTRFEVIENSGHCAQIEQTDRCLEVLLEFLRD